MKYCLSPREISRAEPEGSGNISLYTPTQITIQSFSINSASQYFMKDQCNTHIPVISESESPLGLLAAYK